MTASSAAATTLLPAPARVTPLYALLEPRHQALVRATLEGQGRPSTDPDELDACAAALWDRASLPLPLHTNMLDQQLLHVFQAGRPGDPHAPTLLSSVPPRGKARDPLLFPTPTGHLTALHLHLLGLPAPGGYLTLRPDRVVSVGAFLAAYNAGTLTVAADLHRLLGRRRPWSDVYASLQLAFGCMIRDPGTPHLAACAVTLTPPPAPELDARQALTRAHDLTPGESYVLSLHWENRAVTEHQVFTRSGQRCPVQARRVTPHYLTDDPLTPLPWNGKGSPTWQRTALRSGPLSAAHQGALSRYLLWEPSVALLDGYIQATRGAVPERHEPFRTAVTFTAQA